MVPGRCSASERAHDAVGFGRAVAVDQTEAEALDELPMKMRRHGRRKREPHPVRAVGAARLLRQQDRHHGAENEGDGRLLLGQAAR